MWLLMSAAAQGFQSRQVLLEKDWDDSKRFNNEKMSKWLTAGAAAAERAIEP